MATITLTQLLQEIDVSCADERIVQGISDDSREIQKDWLFLARQGSKVNGEQYIDEVLAKGGVVLWERPTQPNCYHHNDLIQAQEILLRCFYEDPCRHLMVIGVTGTNGKTSVTSILAQMFQLLHKRVMLIGTGHIRYDDVDIAIDNTTPSACMLAKHFHLATALAIPVIIMEVSSHAIDQKRIGFIRFDAIIYTNIASDHLDYHITRTHYQYTKFKLRNYLKQNGFIIVNHDDVSLHPLYDFYDKKIVTIGQTQAHMQLGEITCKASGSHFCFEKECYDMNLLGIHNVYNVAECLIVLHMMKLSYAKRKQIVASLHGVRGRMELHVQKQRYVVIDYAHTASSLKTLLHVVSDLKERRLIVVCGCGGDRDRTKRPQMAQIALMYGDIVIFTTDNPRSEPPSQILMDMIIGQSKSYEIYENRKYAIKYAVKIAQEHDIIVIAGKGDEQFQVINGESYPFSDRDCVKECLEDIEYDT